MANLLSVAIDPLPSDAQKLCGELWSDEPRHHNPAVFVVEGDLLVCDFSDDGFNLVLRQCLFHHSYSFTLL